MLAAGDMSNKQIGRRLFLSPGPSAVTCTGPSRNLASRLGRRCTVLSPPCPKQKTANARVAAAVAAG
jgi:hypothetical protein